MRSVKTGKGHYVLLMSVSVMLVLGGAPAQAQQAKETAPPAQVQPGPSQSQQLPAQTSPAPQGKEGSPAPALASPSQSQQSPAKTSQAEPAPGEAELLHVLVGQSLEVSSPAPIKHFSVSSPDVIDTTLENSSQVRIEGKAPGGVSLVVEDENGQTQIFYVYVDQKDAGLAAQLPEALPETPAPAPVHAKKIAWLGWAVIGSIMLLAGAFFKMRRHGETYRLSLRSPALVPPEGRSEPALAAPEVVRPAEDSSSTIVSAAARQAEDLERVSQETVEQWWRQFRTEAEAAVTGLREEAKNSGKVLEESEERLACLAYAKMASLREATQEEFSMQMALALREHAHEMHEATAAQMESIKKAAGEAVAQLEAAEEKRETTLAGRIGEAEDRLSGMPVALEAVEGRLKALVEGFEGRLESTLQAWQGKFAKQTEELEKLAQELGGRWSEQLQKQAEATIEKLKEEAVNAGRVAEESQRQLASMFEAKLECLNQAVTNATASLTAQQTERAEASQRQLTSLAETKLEDLNLALTNATAGLAAQQKEWAEENQRRLTSLAEAQQKEWAEESQRQLNSAVKAKVESLSQFAVNITSSVQAEHKQLQSQYETSRREFESLVSRRPSTAYSLTSQRGKRPQRRGTVAKLAMATGVFLAIALVVMAFYLWIVPVMQLQAQPPAEFIEESPNWGAARRAREEELAEAYWQAAIQNLQRKYPFGSELPSEPPSEFDAAKQYLPGGGAKALSETRDHYWQKLRKVWVQRECWVETSEWDAQWSSRFKHLLGQLH